MAAAAPAPVQELMDELVEEVLLHLPPDDPASLVRAALVCRRWRRLVAGPGFRRRLREFHRTPPPMLGFLCNLGSVSRFVPTSTFYPPPTDRDWRALDARHGRVLLHGVHPGGWRNPLDSGLFVWDPITDDSRALPKLPPDAYAGDLWSWNAAVLCAGGGPSCSATCDRRHGCGRKPFVVVVVGSSVGRMYACVYSSEVDAWSNRTYAETDVQGHSCFVGMAAPTALVGNALHFTDHFGKRIINYNLDTRGMSVIPLPVECCGRRVVVMAMEDGGPGFATVVNSTLLLYSSVVDPNGQVVAWATSRIIELGKVLPVGACSPLRYQVIGVADGIGVIFLKTDDGIFTLDLNSGHVKKVYKAAIVHGIFPCVGFNS